MSGIVEYDRIEVPVPASPIRTIRLCYGDLTKIPHEWETDFLLLSAFRNDYMETTTSTTGSLARNLGLHIKTVAKHKQEDLRETYGCWYSKPLNQIDEIPTGLPFKRILCFENPVRSQPARDVARLFRGLMTVTSLSTNLKVVSSLLKTGDSGHSKQSMLNILITACVQWMLNGLSLQDFVIVVYMKDTSSGELLKRMHGPVLSEFRNFKTTFLQKILTKAMISKHIHYDFGFSCSSAESSLVGEFTAMLEIYSTSLKICSNLGSIRDNLVWQDEISENIKLCNKVIFFLSPLFVTDIECVEQYNLSLCLSHSLKRPLMAPLYLSQSAVLPNYMTMVQWFHCAEYDRFKMADAAKQIYSLHRDSLLPRQIQNIASKRIFISYAHKDVDTMNIFKECLIETVPGAEIFVDLDDLQAGANWQQSLYTAVEAASVTFCLISKNYLESSVCHEELSLALAASLMKTNCLLIPLELCLGSDKSSSKQNHQCLAELYVHKIHDASDFKSITFETSTMIQKGTTGFEQNKSISLKYNLPDIHYSARSRFFEQQILPHRLRIEKCIANQIECQDKDILILNPAEDLEISLLIKESMQKMCKSHISIQLSNDMSAAELMSCFSDVTLICVVMSQNFVDNATSMLHLHMGIHACRNSIAKRIQVLYLTMESQYPIFLYLLDSKFLLNDPHWKNFTLSDRNNASLSHNVEISVPLLFSYFALTSKKTSPLRADGRSSMLSHPLLLSETHVQ